MGRKFVIIEITQQTYKIYLQDVVRVFKRKIGKNPKLPLYDRGTMNSPTCIDS
jgi:hypothetical protein